MLILLRLALLCLACWPAAAACSVWDEPFIETIDDRDALPDNNVTALAQDQQGFVWVGTPNGLFRYDGYQWRRYANDPADTNSLSGGFIRSLLVAQDGRLWIGTNADGLSVFDPRSGRFSRLGHRPDQADSLSHDGVRHLVETADGSVWIATLNGLNQVDPAGRLRRFRSADGAGLGPIDDRLLALASDPEGTLWVGSWRGLDRRIAGSDRFEPVPGGTNPGSRIAGSSVRSLWADAAGRVWVGTLDGRLLAVDRSTLQVVAEADTAQQDQDSLTVLAMAEPQPGRLWAAGLGGVAVIDGRSGRVLKRIRHQPGLGSGLGTADVRSLLLDHAGQLWLGGYSGGLQRYNGRNRAFSMLFHRPGEPNSLSHPSISAIERAPQDRLYVGTRGNGIDVLDSQRGVIDHIAAPQEPAPNRLSNGVVTALAVAPGDILWAGTDRGLNRINRKTGRIDHYFQEQGLPSNTIRRLLYGADGVLWVGTTAGVARGSGDPLTFTPLRGPEGQPMPEDVNALAADREGRLWVAASADLYTVPPGKQYLQRVLARSGDADQRSHRSAVGLLIDRQQRLWVDTPEGLDRLLDWDGETARFEAISRQVGLAGQPFGANLLEDAQGRLFTARFVLDADQRHAHPLLRSDGVDLGTPWFRSYAADADGNFYFGGARGLLRVKPDLYEAWTWQPPVVISELRVDGRARPVHPTESRIDIEPAARSFAIEFAALDFSAPHLNRYRYRMQGVDPDWVEGDASSRVASYGNLWPGRYRLQIEGSNRDGVWSEQSLQIDIHVLPAWWQTWPAYAAAMLGLLALLIGGNRLYSRHLLRRATALAGVVEQRTSQLREQNQVVETTLQQLRETQQQLLAAEKMAALGQLVAGVAHEINTPIGSALTASSAIASSALVLNERLQQGGMRRSELDQHLNLTFEASALVERSLRRAAHLVQTFKQVSIDQHAEPRQRFLLRPLLQDCLGAMPAEWRQRGITSELSCADDIELDSYPGALVQVIQALADNAALHAFADSTEPRITVQAEASADQLRLRFSDNGCGIPADVLPKIFDPFFTTQRARGGTGLGLHIVFNLVSVRLGGSIVAHSQPGRGSEFELLLPLSVSA